jgi:hypothetical protein
VRPDLPIIVMSAQNTFMTAIRASEAPGAAAPRGRDRARPTIAVSSFRSKGFGRYS